MIFTVYESQTGRVISRLDAPSLDLALLCISENQSLLEGVIGEPGKHRVLSGDLVNLPDAPNDAAVFNYLTGIWEDPRTLLEIQTQACESIKEMRTQTECGGFTWNSYQFDSDPSSQMKIQGAVQLALLAPQDWSIDWTLKDNSTVTLSGSDMVAVGVALGAFISELHAKARQLKDQILAAQTKEEVESVIW